MTIQNPAADNYSRRVGTNLRIDERMKKALTKYCKDKGLSMSDVLNDLLADFLRKQKYLT